MLPPPGCKDLCCLTPSPAQRGIFQNQTPTAFLPSGQRKCQNSTLRQRGELASLLGAVHPPQAASTFIFCRKAKQNQTLVSNPEASPKAKGCSCILIAAPAEPRGGWCLPSPGGPLDARANTRLRRVYRHTRGFRQTPPPHQKSTVSKDASEEKIHNRIGLFVFLMSLFRGSEFCRNHRKRQRNKRVLGNHTPNAGRGTARSTCGTRPGATWGPDTGWWG